MDLDPIDAVLLRELQHDGRATYEALAQAVGLSRVATRARVARLTASGVARIVGVVHPAARGLTAFAHLSILADGAARPIAECIARLDEAPLVSLVAGRHAVVTELRATDMRHLTEVIRKVQRIPGVGHVEASIYTERIKDAHAPPGPAGSAAAADLDEIDQRLLTALQTDGRMSFADLGRLANLSPSATRTRVRDLIEAKVVHVSAIVRPGLLGLGHMCGFALTLADEADVRRDISALPALSYLATTLGRWDAIGTLVAESQAAMVAAVDQIRLISGVRRLEAWTHLDVLKENYALPRM